MTRILLQVMTVTKPTNVPKAPEMPEPHDPPEIPNGLAEANLRYVVALRYISSQTIGLPGEWDALDYLSEASEATVRTALAACIQTARTALAAADNDRA